MEKGINDTANTKENRDVQTDWTDFNYGFGKLVDLTVF